MVDILRIGNDAIPTRNPWRLSALVVAAARAVSATSPNSEAATSELLARAALDRLYAHAGAMTVAGAVVAMCLWLPIYAASRSIVALAWAVFIHVTQLAVIGLRIAFKSEAGARTAATAWHHGYRIALASNALGWGLASVLFIPAADPARAAGVAVAVLGMAAAGLVANATDRVCIFLWVAPVTTPLLLVLLSHGGQTHLLLAAIALVSTALQLRLALAQNHLLSTTLQAQVENAALVERLHRQMELTAQASREKSQFLASASHDLRQPLHALSFFGATLERRMAGSVDQPLIYNMMRSIEALDKSFGAILDISKLDAGAVEPHVQSFPIRDLFRRLQMSFAGQAEEAGLQLRFRAGAKVVTSDPQLLERILANLVQNGLRYSRKGAGVLVGARRRRGGVSLEVWDAGIGIAESELTKVFDEFYQVANPERDRSKGLGMGLAIVKRLSELLGHELTVRSRPGMGSVFRVWVARAHAEQIDEFTVGAETLPGALDEPRTVLLVDDEEAIRTGVGKLLAEWGYDVIAVSTIAEAVAAARRREGLVDVVISDLRLRDGEDGLRAIEQVRAACGFDVPALLVTGDTAPEQVRRVHESGHIVLYKPVQPKDLLTVLKKLA